MRRALVLFWTASVFVQISPAQIPTEWFTEPILPEATRKSQMYAFVNANIPRLPEFDSLAEWERYRAVLKPKLLRLLGIEDIMANHKLRVERKGTLDRQGYTIEKIVYESFPGTWVTAVVWVPKGLRGKAPAAVSISGHNYCDSKATDYVQARAYNLMRRGFIVISYDYFFTFERSRFDACKPTGSNSRDHRNSIYSYTGRTPTGVEVLDGIRAVDYLYSRPDVDRSRIVFTGESGGGNNTYWCAALDERITVAVPVSSSGAYEQWIKADTNFDWHQRPPGIRAFADIGTLYALTAPRPLLVINGHPELEEFSLPDALRSVDYAARIYKLYGKSENIQFRESTTGHGYQADKRVQLYRWLNKWLFSGQMPDGEKDLEYHPEPKENFVAGIPAGNLSIPALAASWVGETVRKFPMPKTGDEARQWQNQARAQLETLLSRQNPKAVPGVIAPRNLYRKESGGYLAEGFQFEVAPDLLLPAVMIRKPKPTPYETIIVLQKSESMTGEMDDLINKGYALLLLDPRGTGEVDSGGSRTANWAEFVGRPMVGQWSEDVSKVATYLLSRTDVKSVSVFGRGIFGKAALYAAALDERIQAAAITLDTLSYRAEATSGIEHIFADVPRILTWGDTAQLAALVAPRPLEIRGAGVPVSINSEKEFYVAPLPRMVLGPSRVGPDKLREAFRWTSDFYRVLGAASDFRTSLDSGEKQ